MSPRRGRMAGGRSGTPDESWRTAQPRPVPVPKDAPNALSVPGSRHAFWLFARLGLVLAAITLTLLVAAAVLAAAHGPGVATALCLCFGLVFGLILVPVAIGTIRAGVVMRDFPWEPYQTSVSVPVTQKVKPTMEMWDDNHGTHWYLKLSVSMASREMLQSGMYRYVWMAGDPGRGCVVVPAGGGPMVWATRDRLMTRQRTGSFTQTGQAYAPDRARTPDKFRVPAPQGRSNALSGPGSALALRRFARRALVWWVAALVVVAVFAVLVVADAPLGAVIGWTYVAVGTAIPLVHTTASVWGATWRMARRPWILYHAAVTIPVSGKVRMEVWPDGDPQVEHQHLRVKATRATRVQLGSTTFRYVWIAGVPGRRAALVPAAGGPLVWAARDKKQPTARRDIPGKTRRTSTKTPKVLLAQEARRKARELERETAPGGEPSNGPS